MMPDTGTVITHLQIVHTWAEFARERDLQFFTPKHLENIAQWADDAIELLKEYERKDACPCTNCECYECIEVCDEYREWYQEGAKR